MNAPEMCPERAQLYLRWVRSVKADAVEANRLSHERRKHHLAEYWKHWNTCPECQAEQAARASGPANPEWAPE
jgi:hypothetical protein